MKKAVLIETLWNVKTYFCKSTLKISSVLIETLWNVKIAEKFAWNEEAETY